MRRRIASTHAAATCPVAALNLAFLVVACIAASLVLAADRGIDVTAAVAPAAGDSAGGGTDTVVRVSADGALEVDGRPLPPDRLAGYLRTKVEAGSVPPVIAHRLVVRPDPGAPYWAVMDALDHLRLAGRSLRLGREPVLLLAADGDGGARR